MEELLDTILLPFALLVVFQLLGLGYSLNTLFEVVDIWLASSGVLTLCTQFIEWITTFFIFIILVFVFVFVLLVLITFTFSTFFLGFFFGSLLRIFRIFTSLFFLTLGRFFDLVVFFRLLLLGSRHCS